MPKATLDNRADVEGLYRTVGIDNYSELSVLLTALEVEKSADKTIWIDGNLTYTIEVSNIDDNTPPYDITNAVVKDKIDTEIAKLVEGTVQIDGAPADPGDFDYDPTTGELVVRIGTVVVGTDRVVSFEVELV